MGKTPKRKGKGSQKATPRKKPKAAPLKRKSKLRADVKGSPKAAPRKKPKAAPLKRKSKLRADVKGSPKAAPLKRKSKLRADVEPLRVGETIVKRSLQSSTWARQLDARKLPETFGKVLESHSRKGPFETHDILVYNHGLKFLGHKSLNKNMLASLGKIALQGAAQVKVAETKIGTEIYVFLGDKPKLKFGVEKSFKARRKTIQRIGDLLDAYWGSFDWWLWFETEELLYD